VKGFNLKQKKHKPVYMPVYVGEANTETEKNFYARIVIKVLLTCMSVMGFTVTLAQIYRLPVSLSMVLAVSFMATFMFSIIGLLLKKRAIFLGMGLFTLMFFLPFSVFLERWETISKNFSTFFDYILHTLDGRLLSTARYAWRSYDTLLESQAYLDRIEWVFLLICVIISLIFTLGSRIRYIGIMLVTAIFLLVPAFGAEIAGYVPGMELFVAGLFSSYAMWVAHAGGAGDIKQKAKPDKTKEPFYKVWPGKPPYLYRHSRNALSAAAMAFVAVFVATNMFSTAVRVDYQKIIEGVSSLTVEVPQGIYRFFKYNFGSINDNGYFGGSISQNISQGISAGSPPTGRTPIIKVTLDDNSEKVYLRASIGVDFDSDKRIWTDSQNSVDFERLDDLLQDFYPEWEYQVYRQKLYLLGYDPDEFMGKQDITIEYLARKNFLLLPTQTQDLFYKNSDLYDWRLDTVIRPAGRDRTNRFTYYMLYPKMSNSRFDTAYAYFSINQSIVDFLTESPDMTHMVFGNYHDFSKINWRLDGISTEDYNYKIKRYAELIGSVYGDIPVAEYDNIIQLIEEMGYEKIDYLTYTDGRGVYTRSDGIEHYYNPKVGSTGITLAEAQFVCDYIRSNYAYSLEVDNLSGSNTYLGNFLFETGQGHCALYATAMTLVMRELGYTARYVNGFVVSGSGEKIENGYEYDLAERDLHAWVEVYFPELGWVPFDPTGGVRGEESGTALATTRETTERTTVPRTITTPTAPTTRETTTRDPNISTPTSQTTDDDDDDNEPDESYIMLILMITALSLIPIIIFVSVYMSLKALTKAERDKFDKFQNAHDNKTAEEMYRFMLKLLKSEGIVSGMRGEPPTQFAERVDSTIPFYNMEQKLSDIMPVFEKLEFSNFDLNTEEYASLYEYVAALYGITVTQRKGLSKLSRRIKFNK